MFLLFTKRKKRAQVEARDERNAERQVDRERLNGMWINTETKSMLVQDLIEDMSFDLYIKKRGYGL